jgi:pyrroloquinoline quinone (PQQ) biosynthesis protein C
MVIGEVAAVIAAVAAAGATSLGFVNRKKIQEVHLLVNSQLTTVMQKLDVATGKIVVLEAAAQHSYETQTPPGPVASVLQTPQTSEYPPGTLRPSET